MELARCKGIKGGGCVPIWRTEGLASQVNRENAGDTPFESGKRILGCVDLSLFAAMPEMNVFAK